MRYFLATISPNARANWQMCKVEGVWGVKEAGGTRRTGTANARRVQAGDLIFVWLSKNPRRRTDPSGLAAVVEVLGGLKSAASGAHIPWPDPKDYAGSFPIRVVEELAEPVGDRFEDQVSVHFGIENIALIHGFRELTDPEVVKKIKAIFTA